MAAGNWSSADSSDSSPVCTASVATCRIRSAVVSDAWFLSIRRPPAKRAYPVLQDREVEGKFHPISYIFELVSKIASYPPLQSLYADLDAGPFTIGRPARPVSRRRDRESGTVWGSVARP